MSPLPSNAPTTSTADLGYRRNILWFLAVLVSLTALFAVGVALVRATDSGREVKFSGPKLDSSRLEPSSIERQRFAFPNYLVDEGRKTAAEQSEEEASHEDRRVELPAGRWLVGEGAALRHLLEGQKSLPEKPGERKPISAAGSDGRFVLHVMSFPQPARARAFAALLRRRGHPAFIAHHEGGDRGDLWRVRVGPFANEGSARRYRREFESREFMNTVVIDRSKENHQSADSAPLEKRRR